MKHPAHSKVRGENKEIKAESRVSADITVTIYIVCLFWANVAYHAIKDYYLKYKILNPQTQSLSAFTSRYQWSFVVGICVCVCVHESVGERDLLTKCAEKQSAPIIHPLMKGFTVLFGSRRRRLITV